MSAERTAGRRRPGSRRQAGEELLVVVDVGNTNTVFGVYRGDRLLESFRLSTDTERTGDEYGSLLLPLFSRQGIDPLAADAVVISSVVPPLHLTLDHLAQRYFGRRPLFIEPGVRTGMPIRYDNPQEVGADRVVNSVAARERYGAPVIVVDFGTATTFDVVNAAGEYIGGIIAPGITFCPRFASNQGRCPQTRRAGGQEHRRRHPGRHLLRLRRAGGRYPRAPAGRDPGGQDGRRHRRPGRPDRQRLEAHPRRRSAADPARSQADLRAQPGLSAARERGVRRLSDQQDDGLDDQAYFLAIEDHFVRLRGAPLLLSPADWQAARRWHRQGIPLELVRRALEEVFARRRERGAKGRISSLRYCAPAVEAAWVEHSELAAPGARVAPEAFDAAARLRALAAALPADLPAAAALRAEIAGLARAGLDPQGVEERLAEIDRQALDAALAGLGAAERAALDAAVEQALGAVAGRLATTEVERARGRLARQVLRERLGLPMLSLFSPEAMHQDAPVAPPVAPPARP
jgi:hypothetical protein